MNPAIIGPLDVVVFPGNGGGYQGANPPSILPGFVSFHARTGLFGIRFFFNLDPTISDVFAGGETTTAGLGRSGLRATDFVATSIDKPGPNDPAAGGWYASAQVRGIQLPGGRDDGRGYVGANTHSVVPEPSSFAVAAGFGGLALARMALRRRREQGHSDRRSS